jgi:hypothetical protein
MRALSDKWNPRLWLRDWINRPSQVELGERRAAEAVARQMFDALDMQCATRSRALHSQLISSLERPLQQVPLTSGQVAPEEQLGTPEALNFRTLDLRLPQGADSRTPELLLGLGEMQEVTPAQIR